MSTKFESTFRLASKLEFQHPEIIAELSNRLALRFMSGKNEDGNVCYIESDEVRPEYREVFTSADVSNYLLGLSHSLNRALSETDFSAFPYPKDANEFWQFVKTGVALRSKST